MGIRTEPQGPHGGHEGRSIGRYVLGSLLGAGGMGEVYRARDQKLGRDIAVKILPVALAQDPDRLARFEREARVLASLNHPHIAAIYGFEESDDLPALLLELVDGQTLAERLEAGPLKLDDALLYASQVADALYAAHQKGIVHRDLKPANIKITSAGTVKVLDFGLAKAAAENINGETVAQLTATREGVILGTAPYMSPEQARGRPVDQRTDIWAFGCVLYEMLTGRRAFSGASTVDVLSAIVNQEPDFNAFPSATPGAVRALLVDCLRKEAAQRAADIGVVKSIIDVARHPRRSTRTVSAIAFAGVLIAVAAVWATVTMLRPSSSSDARDISETAVKPDVAAFAALRPVRLTASSGFDGFLSFSHDGQSVAYSSDRSGSMEIYVEGLAGSAPLQLTRGGQNVQPEWSPDGQFIAYHEMAGDGIWIVPSRGGVTRQISDFGSNPSWSPSGRQVAFQSAALGDLNSMGASDTSTIWVADVDANSEPVKLTSPGQPPGAHMAPSWSSDGRSIMFAALSPRTDNALWSVAVSEGVTKLVFSHPRITSDFALAPGGRGVFFRARDAPAIWWFALSNDGEASGEPHSTGLAVSASSILHFTVSPDGRRMGWTALDQTGNVWSTGLTSDGLTSRGEPVALTDGGGVRFGQPSAASDGRIVMVGSRPGSNTGLFLLPPRVPLRQLTTDPQAHGAPRWMSGDQEVAYVTDHGDGPGYWAISTATARERLLFPFSALPRAPGGGQPTLSGPALAHAMTPDLSRFAFAVTRDGIANIWVALLEASRPTGQLVQRTFEKEGGTFPSVSPDGRWLAYQCQTGFDTHLCLTSVDAGERVQLTHEPGQSWTGGWSSDSDKILIAARRNAVWNVAWVSRSTGRVQPLTRFTRPRSYVRYPRWDRANNRVLFEYSDTVGRLWTVELPPSVLPRVQAK